MPKIRQNAQKRCAGRINAREPKTGFRHIGEFSRIEGLSGSVEE